MPRPRLESTSHTEGADCVRALLNHFPSFTTLAAASGVSPRTLHRIYHGGGWNNLTRRFLQKLQRDTQNGSQDQTG